MAGMDRKQYIFNPKLEGSGMVGASPQETECPRNCPDCYAGNDRAYATLPNYPTGQEALGRVVRIGDISDAYHEVEKSIRCAEWYHESFMNTSYPELFKKIPDDIPVVLTVNPGEMRDINFYELDPIPPNLMFVRVLINMWNWQNVTSSAVTYYTDLDVPVVLTWLAYYEEPFPAGIEECYAWTIRTLNSYWCILPSKRIVVESTWWSNPLVHTCGYKNTYKCKNCGNCLSLYFACKERMSLHKNKD